MRTLAVFLLLIVICQGKRPDNPCLIDLLKRYSVAQPVNRAVQIRQPSTSPSPFEWDNPASPAYNTSTAHSRFEDDYAGVEEAFFFPGSRYLIRLIEQYIKDRKNEHIKVEDIRDYFELPECDMKDVMKTVFTVSKALDIDPEGVALLATRMLMKPILTERMRCPAAILDMGVIRTLMSLKQEYVQEEDESVYTFFKQMVPLVDPVLEPYAVDIAKRGVHEFHGTIFNESIEYLMQFGLKDLAFASHRLFAELVDHFRYAQPDLANRENELKYRVQNSLWEVRCPDSYEVVENHRRIIWRFREVFGMVETEHVCPRVIDFLYKYVNNTIPGYMPNFENSSTLHVVCEELKEVIDDIVDDFTEYGNVLYSMNIPAMENMFKDALSPEEWHLLEEALRRLGFMEMVPQ